MKVTLTKAGNMTIVDRKVKIRKANQIPDEYLGQLKSASSVINRYLNRKSISVRFTPTGNHHSGTSLIMDLRSHTPFLKHRTTDLTTTSIQCTNDVDKPFLRKIYEEIQEFVDGTAPRVEELKRKTRAKLVQMGRIKK